MINYTNGELEESLQLAQKMKDQSLRECIDYLTERENKGAEIHLFPSFVPNSFYFRIFQSGRFREDGFVMLHGSLAAIRPGVPERVWSMERKFTTHWEIH